MPSRKELVRCVCRVCQKVTLTRPSQVKVYCSKECMRRERGVEKKTYNCPACGKEFQDYACKNPIYCSRACKHSQHGAKLQARGGHEFVDMRSTRTCEQCGKDYQPKTRLQRLCSRQCTGASLSGSAKGTANLPRKEKRPAQSSIPRSCQVCKREFFARGRQKTCSRRCGRVVGDQGAFSYGNKGFREDIQLHVKSSLEADFVRVYRKLGYTVTYEPRAFLTADGRSYRPDFWVEELQTFFELKGWIRDSEVVKLNLSAVEAEGQNIKLLMQSQFLDFVKSREDLKSLKLELLEEGPFKGFKKEDKTCPICGVVFKNPIIRSKTTCSRSCANRLRKKQADAVGKKYA